VIPPDTQRVLDFLGDARSYSHAPSEVRLVQTHASWVFLASPHVFKMKKPVDFGFLDFTTLEKRRADCEREVALNRRLAPDVYLGVVPVCDTPQGLRFGEGGPVVEWLVRMRELDASRFLSNLLDGGEVTTAMMDQIVDCLLAFYRSQPPLSDTEAVLARRRLAGFVRDNFTAARDFTGLSLSAAALAAMERFSTEFERRHGGLLESRAAGGWIRDCHGDLHSEHIHIEGPRVRIYDCTEFNEAFRHIDVACDLAFLAMDLDFHGRPDLSRHLVRRFAELLPDASLERLMDFYKCYRACVRGKVESLHSLGETVGEAERAASAALARSYHRLALRYAIGGSQARVRVFMGRVASGKSALAEALGAETGWRVASSDRVRKTIAGVPLHERGTAAQRAELYSPEMTSRVYNALLGEALAEAGQGHSLIVDATFSARRHRDAFQSACDAAGVPVTWVMAEAGDDVTLSRLRQRAEDSTVVSDARAEDQAMLGSRFEPPDELDCLCISTEEEAPATLERLMLELAARNAAGA
jgi:aminoglycoside phosphotransferase family enzyme/predicted kinase